MEFGFTYLILNNNKSIQHTELALHRKAQPHHSPRSVRATNPSQHLSNNFHLMERPINGIYLISFWITKIHVSLCTYGLKKHRRIHSFSIPHTH